MTPEQLTELVEFEKSIQWRWSSGDPTGYMDALTEDATYSDPLTDDLLIGRDAVRDHFRRIHGDAGITRQEYLNEHARSIGDDEGLLIFTFNTYQQGADGEEKLFLSWNMTLIFRLADGAWLMRHGHLSLRNAWDIETLPRLRDVWTRNVTPK